MPENDDIIIISEITNPYPSDRDLQSRSINDRSTRPRDARADSIQHLYN